MSGLKGSRISGSKYRFLFVSETGLSYGIIRCLVFKPLLGHKGMLGSCDQVEDFQQWVMSWLTCSM